MTITRFWSLNWGAYLMTLVNIKTYEKFAHSVKSSIVRQPAEVLE